MGQIARLAWRVENAASKDAADLYVYDMIGDPWGDGTNANEFVQALNAIDAKTIRMHVNSPGGYVDHALAMYNALLQHPAEIEAYIEGSADSAASFLVQAADKRYIAKNARMTIHEAQGFASGPATTMREAATLLDEESDNIAAIYAERTGIDAAEWRARMQANGGVMGTTYRGQGAVDAGLADEVTSVPAKNWQPMRAVAQSNTDEPPPPPVDLGAAIRAARYTKPEPTIQQLLEQHQGVPLSAAIAR